MRLELEKSVLRRWQLSDAESLSIHANDYEIWKNLRDAFPHPYTIENAEIFLGRVASTDALSLAIEVDGEVVGSVGGKP